MPAEQIKNLICSNSYLPYNISVSVSYTHLDVYKRQVFRCKLDGADIGELMSMEGAVLKGVDIKTGKTRSIVAYYKYYRKV